jgi:hypothetical protein
MYPYANAVVCNQGAMTLAKEAITRAPRGTKILAQAFLTAADEIPEPQRKGVVKAALALIRDKLKEARDKTKANRLKQKTMVPSARRALPVKRVGRPKGSKNEPKTVAVETKDALPVKRTPKRTASRVAVAQA